MTTEAKEAPEAAGDFLTPDELVKRFKGVVNPKTLANWRTRGDGPPYIKVGGRVLYKRADVSAWEARRRRGRLQP